MTTVAPREPSALHNNLVDACLEESAYAAAISLLDQSRSECLRPANDHIRVLVFIALHPPLQGKRKYRKPNEPAPAAPKRRGRKKVTDGDDLGELHIPTPTECANALRVLHTMIRVIHPAYILCALPAYVALPYASPPQSDLESVVARRASILASKKDCIDCWAMLREGFITPADADVSMQVDDEQEEPVVVGRIAWPVLAWLVDAYERDAQSRVAGEEQPLTQPAILTQVTQDRLNGMRNGPIVDCRKPVEIAKFCLVADNSQSATLSQQERHTLGLRLINLLYDLTLPATPTALPQLDPTNLVKQLALHARQLPLPALGVIARGVAPPLLVAVLALHISYLTKTTSKGLFAGDGFTLSLTAPPYPPPSLNVLRPLILAPAARSTTTTSAERMVQVKAMFWLALHRSLPLSAENGRWISEVKTGSVQKLVRASFQPFFDSEDEQAREAAQLAHERVVDKFNAMVA
ncbi:hypothetical protein BKA62DRAFT_680872 [Auriculariales sp. MPI-PUGE-AT-0066]|nr:hypothetical protein BKA62DRAFT_680872 [Auriculariales sp. MPI-PUGE-AT-0066]